MNTKGQNIQNNMQEIAHQWRQPLSEINSIVFVIDTLLDEMGVRNTQLEEQLKKIENITKYMSHTIDDIQNKSVLNNSKFSVISLIDEISQLVVNRLEKNNIELIVDVKNTIIIESNKNLLIQSLMNIINNSIDILLERNIFNSFIKIICEEKEKEIILYISDNGGGMTKNVMAKIFTKEYTQKHSSLGSGLGLYMTKSMIEKELNGSVTVFNLDSGICFEIRLNKGMI